MGDRKITANHSGIYTYDYAPDSVWNMWREQKTYILLDDYFLKFFIIVNGGYRS